MPGSPRLARDDRTLARLTMRGLVLRRRGGPPVLLDGSGWLVWDTLREPAPAGDVVARVVGSVDATPAVVTADVERVLEELAQHGLIRPA